LSDSFAGKRFLVLAFVAAKMIAVRSDVVRNAVVEFAAS
jgi:hypothetical protein